MSEKPSSRALANQRPKSLWVRWRYFGSDRALTAKPQRLGFLPTWTFWRRPDVQKASWPLFTILGLPVALFLGFSGALGLQLPWWGIAAILLGYSTLAEGFIERYIRRRIQSQKESFEESEVVRELLGQ